MNEYEIDELAKQLQKEFCSLSDAKKGIIIIKIYRLMAKWILERFERKVVR